ncbi:unnamed protein product [Psylliodes chrysocephalus]|uniref:CoA carboxyltransferase C-terminal domain-containing protein n=1 Tax=Psylliodes chrysocephalus TaxID=3402493 RepID=A0A9P0D8Q1_9CUCU|nr:unnamed protein product [Psylliodes chrysocephala]
MSSKNLRSDINYCWPTAEVAVMGAEGAVAILYKGHPDIKEKEAEYKEKFGNPYYIARKGFVEDVIEPRTTRRRLCKDLEMLENKRLQNPSKKHGNIPL